MVKVLARSIREFKKASILTPLLVSVEVILECAIPFVIAQLVNQMQAGCSMDCDCPVRCHPDCHVCCIADFRSRCRCYLCCCFYRIRQKFKKRYVLQYSELFF